MWVGSSGPGGPTRPCVRLIGPTARGLRGRVWRGTSVADALHRRGHGKASPQLAGGRGAGGGPPPGEFPASDRGRPSWAAAAGREPDPDRTGGGQTGGGGGRVVRRRHDERRIYPVQSEPRQRCVRRQRFEAAGSGGGGGCQGRQVPGYRLCRAARPVARVLSAFHRRTAALAAEDKAAPSSLEQ
ncbi:unnamed protein product [Arctogadus glacialis]